MNDDRTLERAARSWLEEGPTQAPDRTVEGALSRIQATRQERDLWIPWRFPTMKPLTRIAMVAAVAAVSIGVALYAFRPASQIGPPASPSAAPTPSPSSAATAATLATMELPAAKPLAPAAVIDLAGMVTGSIPLTSNGTDVWVGVDGGFIHIDGQTNATQHVDVAALTTSNGEIAIASDGLWIEDQRGGRVERVDAATGVSMSTIAVQGPRWISYVNDELWIGTTGTPGAYLVDRVKGKLGPRIGTSTVFAIGLGDIWLGDGARVITRYDASTGAAHGTIDVPAGTGCRVTGEFPDNVWAACPADFGTCPAGRIAVRIDPATNRVLSTAKICGSPVAIIEGTPWFLAGRMDGQDIANSLVSVDPASGRLLKQFDLGKLDADVVVLTTAANWISDEENDRVVRYDFAALKN